MRQSKRAGGKEAGAEAGVEARLGAKGVLRNGGGDHLDLEVLSGAIAGRSRVVAI